MFKKQLLSFKESPEDIKKMTVKFKDCAKGRMRMSDFWKKEKDKTMLADPTKNLAKWLSETLPHQTRIKLNEAVMFEQFFQQALTMDATTKRLLAFDVHKGHRRDISSRIDAILREPETARALIKNRPGNQWQLVTQKTGL